MKRTVYLYLTVLSLLFACLPSNAQQAFYIYRNDGVINTFFTTEIDSMTYSSLDVDSIEHSDFVVQEVYTPDSIYRIPIEKIDSVGFITPETKYQPGVTVLEGDLRSYIVSRDNLTLTFSSDIPNSLLPRKGDKLVSTVGDEYLQSAFVGQVAEIHNGASGVEVVCEPVDLLDVFECYYGIPAVKPQTRGIIDGTYTTGTQTFSPGKLKFKALDNHDFQFAYNPNDELSFSIDKAKVEASVTPTITYNSVIVINKHYGINVSVTAISDLTFEQYAELCGSVTYNKDISLLKPVIPLPEALVDIYFELGVFWNVSGTLATEQLCRQNIKHVFHWDWSSRGHEVLQNVNKIYQKENSHQGKVALSGSVSAGGYGKVAVAFITQSIGLDIAEVGVRVEGGMRCEGTYVPYKEDKEYAKTSTDLYNQIKDQRVPLTLFYTSKAEAKLAKWSVNYDIPNIFKIPFQKQITIGEFCSVPDFSDTKLEKDEFGTYFASTKASGQLFSNTDIGFALINDNDKNDATYTYVKDYQGPSSDIYASFFDKSKESKYTVYPLVKYMDMELIAEPFAKIEEQLCKDTNHPHMIDLGLPSGTKWSCCNVGAQKPEDYGAYINWNDAVAMFSDEKSGDLRLPTKEECEELVNECSWTWTTQNGVNGQLVTGPNGNSIFIPAAGVQYYYEEVDVYEEEGVGRMGRFWSSDDFWRTSDGEKYHRAYDIVFGKTYFELDDDGCGGNYSVRPVAKQ